MRVLIDAALASGDTRSAIDAMPSLARTQSLAPDDQVALDTRALAAALAAAPDASTLNALWGNATRAQRRRPELIAAFARRSAALGQMLAAMDEIESAERREWSDALALAYADLGPAELPARTRKAESWLALAPNSAALATALGRLCALQSLWGKSEQYLERALALDETPLAWETLGDCYAGSDDVATASTATRVREGIRRALCRRRPTGRDLAMVTEQAASAPGVARRPTTDCSREQQLRSEAAPACSKDHRWRESTLGTTKIAPGLARSIGFFPIESGIARRLLWGDSLLAGFVNSYADGQNVGLTGFEPATP